MAFSGHMDLNHLKTGGPWGSVPGLIFGGPEALHKYIRILISSFLRKMDRKDIPTALWNALGCQWLSLQIYDSALRSALLFSGPSLLPVMDPDHITLLNLT